MQLLLQPTSGTVGLSLAKLLELCKVLTAPITNADWSYPDGNAAQQQNNGMVKQQSNTSKSNQSRQLDNPPLC